MIASAVVLTTLSPAHTASAAARACTRVFGIGFGMVNPPITYTAVSGMPNNQAGVAAAVASTSRQVGQALGVAVIGLDPRHGGRRRRIGTQLASASHPAWWVIAGCGASVLALGLATTGRWAQRTRPRHSGGDLDEDTAASAAGGMRTQARRIIARLLFGLRYVLPARSCSAARDHGARQRNRPRGRRRASSARDSRSTS